MSNLGDRGQNLLPFLEAWWRQEGLLDHCMEDQTTQTTVKVTRLDPHMPTNFILLAKKPGIFSGRAVLDWISQTQEGWIFQKLPTNGQEVRPGQEIVQGKAPLDQLLARERMLLNLMQHLCGIASTTRELVTTIQKAWTFKTPAPTVLHTRKFLPFMRKLESQACLDGGAQTHRLHLGDRILFKDNHKKVLALGKKSISEYLEFLEALGFLETALIEVETKEEGHQALAAGVRHLLLDNFTPEDIRDFCSTLPAGDYPTIEISGSLNMENVSRVLVHERITRLSFGFLTHSVKALDISLELLL